MLVVSVDELTAYTELEGDICLLILGAIQRECGEIGNVLIEDHDISFEVYRGYFEDPPKVIKNSKFTLKLFDKLHDQFFTVVYQIHTHRKMAKKEVEMT